MRDTSSNNLSSAVAQHVEEKNFDSWLLYDGMVEGSGRSEKEWIISPDRKEIGLFKYPKTNPETNERSTTEHVSEHLAYRIGQVLDVPTARIDIGIRNGRIGCVSYLINKLGREEIREGVNYILAKYPDYNSVELRDEKTGTYYNIEMIVGTLDGFFAKEWIRMMLFDFVIGNSDRHQSNWGYIFPDKDTLKKEGLGPVFPCPLYDNGSSLCSIMSDEKVERCFGKDRLFFESVVTTKSKSLIRIHGEQRRKPTHEEVVKHLLEHYPDTLEIAQRFVAQLTEGKIDSLLDAYPERILDAQRNALIRKYLKRKMKILAHLVVVYSG